MEQQRPHKQKMYKCNGGVNVIDVRSKIQSLKIPWLIRWLKSPLWEPVTEAFLKKIGCSLQMLLHMNIKSLVDFPILSNLPSFYQELWLAFYAYKSAKPVRLMSDYDFFITSCLEKSKF